MDNLRVYERLPLQRRVLPVGLVLRIKELGFRTLTDYCKANGFQLSYMSRITNGWQIPSGGERERIANSLKCKPEDIFRVDDNPNPR